MNLRRHFLVFALPLPLPLRAGTSANYALDPEVIDSGGLRGTSAAYTANFSNAPGTAGSSAAFALRTGFSGVLADVSAAAALQITASPLSVGEGAASQLSASALYDDFTRVTVTAGSVAWSVESGPVTGISTSGLATAAIVYQNSSAVVRGTWLSLSGTATLNVVNTSDDNFGSYAGDFVADDWQVLYFGLNNPMAGPNIDADGDSYDNLFEFNASLNPVDPLSVFSFKILDAPGGGHSVSFSPRFPGSTYTLMGSTNLLQWAPVAGTVTDAGTLRTVLDTSGFGRRRFYFIRIQRE